jgi:hypothetical protein
VPQEAVRELEGIDGVLMGRYLPTEAGAAA